MNAFNIIDEYIDIINQDINKYYKDYLNTVKAVANSNAVYKGQPIPFLYEPMFYTEEDLKIFKYIGKMIMSITDKVSQQYIDSPEYRKKFGYPKQLEELILIDNGYDINVPIGRFDLFYGGNGNFKFCEFNTDGSSAMNEDNTLARILLETEAMKVMKERYNAQYFELIYKWVDESINIYKKFNNENSKPNVAIVDFKESGTPAEFQEFKIAYTKRGYRAEIVDPRELKYEDGKLYFHDMVVDLIYRRIVTKDFVEQRDEINDLIMAYKDRAVCVVGSLKSQIMHNKIIFKILKDNDTFKTLNEEERNFIKKHIPFTEELKGGLNVYNKVLKNKNKYIIKPLDSYGSKGVYAGRDFSEIEWREVVNECWNKDYIYQEFVTPYTRPFILFEEGKLTVRELGTITGIFLYNKNFAGLYTRVGEDNIISGLHNYYTVPNILIRGKY